MTSQCRYSSGILTTQPGGTVNFRLVPSLWTEKISPFSQEHKLKLVSVYDKGGIKLTCHRRYSHKKMWIDQTWIQQRGKSWVKGWNYFCCIQGYWDGTEQRPISQCKRTQTVNINHAKVSFFTTFLSKSCLVWNAWAWYAEGGNSQKMWFSPNHRANHALWFWFPCITGLKLWNHLIRIHTYMQTHMHAHTTKQIQILDSETKSCTRSVTSPMAHPQHLTCDEFPSRNHSTGFTERHFLWWWST